MNNNTISLSDISFVRPRAKLAQYGQVGSHQHLMSMFFQRPRLAKLQEYEYIAKNDVTTKACISIMLETLLSFLGEPEHVDPEIQEFLRNNVSLLSESGVNHQEAMFGAFETCLWSGFSTTEVLLTQLGGELLIKDFVTYHPATIKIRTNKKGRLTEGEPSLDGFKSGIYQTSLTNQPEIQLPLWKVCHLRNGSNHGSPYGQSALDSIYKWYLLAEAITDMMTTALDRFGSPIIVLALPVVDTKEETIDPETGEARFMTTEEIFRRQVQQGELQGGNLLVLPFVNESAKPEAKTLTTGNNVGSTFIDAIDFCDVQKCRGLLFPYILLAASRVSTGSNEYAARQTENYHMVLRSMYRKLVEPWVAQTWHRVIKFNFNRDSAKIAPKFPMRQTTRPEDCVALMQLVNGLSSFGYLNPTAQEDWKMVREWVTANTRTMSKQDIEFVKQQVVYPKQKEAPQRHQDGTPNETRDRSLEGSVNGEGRKGRPLGTSSPQDKPREARAD